MFERSSAIIRDGKKLAFEYIPDKLVCRDAQMTELENAFRPLFFNNVPCTAYVTGSVGTGKTVTVRKFCSDMREEFSVSGKSLEIIYVNCRLKNSEYGVMLELVRHYDRLFSDRGFSVDQMISSLKQHINSEKTPVVIILDEADVILRSSAKNVVYQLTRFSEDATAGIPVSLILISQYSLQALALDQASQSSFGRSGTVKFDKYNEDQLRDIVKLRADLALGPGSITDDGIGMIAKISAPYGDARLAMEILEKAANLAETKGARYIDLDHIRTAGASVYSDVSESKLESLDLNRLLVLLSIARSLFKNPEVTTLHAQGTYAAACEEFGVPAKKYTQYYTYVKDLEARSLIKTELRPEPAGGRATYITITGIPPRDLTENLEGMIESRLRREDMSV